MEIQNFLEHLNSGKPVYAGSEEHKMMCELSCQAMQITSLINGSYNSPNEIKTLFSQLIGKPLDDTFMLFTPFYTDCGKNISLGKEVFINSNCNFQDQGGIFIGEKSLIGHKVTLATLNHGITPEDRSTLYPKPIIIGKNVWIGASATILPGVTIGDNSIIGAGSVVTKNIPANSIAIGNPCRVVKSI